jgi:hypothetical protein
MNTSKSLRQLHEYKRTFRGACGNFHILGELPVNLSHLRITLLFIEFEEGRRYRAKIDLYENMEIDRFCYEVLEREFKLDYNDLRNDVKTLVDLLENFRERLYQKLTHSKPKRKVNQVDLRQKEFLAVLSRPDLLDYIDRLLVNAGIIGEVNNRLLLFLIAVSYRSPYALHAIIQSSSGSGKSHLLKTIMGCIPEVDRLSLSRITGKSLFNFGENDLLHKAVFIQDMDGFNDDSLYGFRELQSEGVLTSSTSYKDRLGNIASRIKTVKGCFSSIASTTKTHVYQDNLSRSIPVQLDESVEQTVRIVNYQNKKIAGVIDPDVEQHAMVQLQLLISELNRCEVVNPFAEEIQLPMETHYLRRSSLQLQRLIQVIAFVHQFQRERTKQGKIIATKVDVENGIRLFSSPLNLKTDDLDGQTRSFFEALKRYMKGREHYNFTQFELRKALKTSKTQTFRFTQKLLRYEYIVISGGSSNRGYLYQIQHWDNPVNSEVLFSLK